MNDQNQDSRAGDGGRGQRRYIRTVASIAALGGLLFGYDTGVMSGALLFLVPEFEMTAAEQGWVTSMLLVGAAVGALFGGRVAAGLGRRRTLVLGGVIFTLGSLWCAAATSVVMLGAARTFLGLAVGAVSIVVPMYISEMVPPLVRGRLVTLNTLMIVVGQLSAYLVNSALAPTGNWHLMLGLAAVPGAALAIGMYLLPDTPAWYARRGEFDRAYAVARKTGVPRRQVEAVADGSEVGETAHPVREILRERWLLVAVLIAMGVGVTQQVTGANAVIYFAPSMMSQVGISTTNSVYTSILIGVVSVAACWVGLRLVDRVGRKRLLTIGLAGNISALVALAVIFNLSRESTLMAALSLALMAVFMAFQQSAVSVVTWLLISELVPLRVRGLGMGLAGLALWVANWAVAQFFLPLVEALTGAGAFAVFAVLGVIALLFVRRYVPETMGRRLEDVSDELRERHTRSP